LRLVDITSTSGWYLNAELMAAYADPVIGDAYRNVSECQEEVISVG
jgi:hypothetical protein